MTSLNYPTKINFLHLFFLVDPISTNSINGGRKYNKGTSVIGISRKRDKTN